MIKIEEITKVVQERHKFCDECNKEISIGLCCSKAICEYCKKDLCESCIGHEVETPYDYREVYCKVCWEIKKEYEILAQPLEDKLRELYKEMHEKCGKFKCE